MEPSFLQSIILGIVQGLSEFLPISSTGHLVLTEHFMGVKPEGTAFEVAVHIGTLGSVLIYFRKRLFQLLKSLWTPSMKAEHRMIFMLFLGTLPAVFAGLLIKPYFEVLKENPVIVCSLLCVTAVLLFLQRRLAKGTLETAGPKQALTMGCFQAFAILPGVSRSGSTIVGGLITKLKPATAAEFSFLLSIPAILGAVVLDREAFSQLNPTETKNYIAGAIAAFIAGLVAVYWVMQIVRKGKLEYFAYYCALVGVLGISYFSLIR